LLVKRIGRQIVVLNNAVLVLELVQPNTGYIGSAFVLSSPLMRPGFLGTGISAFDIPTNSVIGI